MGPVGAVVGTLGLVLLLSLSLQESSSFAHQMFRHVPWLTSAPTADPDTTTEARTPRTFSEMAMHPARMHPEYFSRTFASLAQRDSALLQPFHDLLDLYAKRQGVDGNFSIRVVDGRTYEVLEVFTLKQLQERYRNGASMDWRRVDRYRRQHTRRLVDKYEERGVPRDDIIVRWGRAHQVHAAHEREQPILQYEVNLARYLGLSLLPTEMATVETFNQDDMVSPVGAKSRYQMMPWILRRSGVHAYSLRTPSGHRVAVKEELHPLLTLEASFTLLRGYVNAVGHEFPGISAYHTGPGNIYTVFRLFFAQSEHFDDTATVADAFLWGVTDGYEVVREASTFGPYSRGYVPSAYGAFMANPDRSVDPSQTLRAVRVQVAPGEQVTLHTLLDALTEAGPVDWGPAVTGDTPYERFRDLNPHVELPASANGAVPPTGNVRFVASVDGSAVRFFLPLAAPDRLQAAGLDVLNAAASFRFDDSTYTAPERTRWDRQYEALVDDIARFGFTEANKQRVLQLHKKFADLAEASPTHYRRMQLDIIETHRRIWLSAPWDKLAEATRLAKGSRMRVQPPTALQTDDIPTTLHTAPR